MATPSSMIARLRARRGDWRTLIQPRSVAVVIALGGIVVLTFGLNFVGPAREGLPVLSRQPVRLFAGTVAAAREVFSGAGDDSGTTEVVAAAGTTPDGSPPLRPSEPVATLGDDDEPLTVAEVRRLVDDDPSRAQELVFLPGVTVGQATEMLDRAPTPAQVPGRPVRPATSTTTSTTRPTSTTTTTRPRPRLDPEPAPAPTWPSTTAPVTTAPVTTPTEPTVPEPTVPEPTVPEPTVPEPTVPEPTEPEPTVPEPTVPEPTVPEPTVPEPTVPEPTEPEPTVPESTVPETVPDDPPIELPDIEIPDLGL